MDEENQPNKRKLPQQIVPHKIPPVKSKTNIAANPFNYKEHQAYDGSMDQRNQGFQLRKDQTFGEQNLNLETRGLGTNMITEQSYMSHDPSLKNLSHPMNMKDSNLAVHQVKIKSKRGNQINRQDALAGLDSPFTLSDQDLPAPEYDIYSENSLRQRQTEDKRYKKEKMMKSAMKSAKKTEIKEKSNWGENTVLQTSANMLLDNSYLSAMHTYENVTDEDASRNEWSSYRKPKNFNNVSKYRPGTIVPIKEKFYKTKGVKDTEQPKTIMSDYDYMKRLLFHKEKMLQIDSMCKWKKKDFKGMKKKIYINEIQKRNDKILKITEKTDLEQNEVYHDRYPFLGLRRSVGKFFIWCHLISASIINSQAFDNISVTVIIVNSVVMAIEEPGQEQTAELEILDYIFTGLYTVEMLLKIMGMGFIMNKGSYLRDSWNILDFFIVITSYIPIFQLAFEADTSNVDTEVGPQSDQSESFGFSSLRTFRVLRPLKTISSVQGLKVIMSALFAAMPLLVDTLMILTFFFFVFAIAGSQLFTGMLKNRCINIQNGRPHDDEELLCGPENECPGGFFCGKSNENPNYGVSNFDTIFYSLLMVFQSVTLEGWSDLMVLMEQVFIKPIINLFMIPLVFIGAFFLLNLTLAVINSSFNETHKRYQQQKEQEIEEAEGDVEAEMEKKLQGMKEVMSISQYITARVYAKKMVEFLRMRQRIKQIEKERTEMLKKKRALNRNGVTAVPGQPLKKLPSSSAKKSEDISSQMSIQVQNEDSDIFISNSKKIENGGDQQLIIKENQDDGTDKIIFEEEGEQQDDKSDVEKDQHLKDVQNLIKNSKVQMIRDGKQTSDISTPKILKNSLRKGNMSASMTAFHGIQIDTKGGSGPGPQMMGNIGLTKQGVVLKNRQQKQKQSFKDNIAFELDIDKVLGNGADDKQSSGQLSPGTTNKESTNRNKKKKTTIDFAQPDLAEQEEEYESGLITSDSDFEEAVRQAGIQSNQLSPTKISNKDTSMLQTSTPFPHLNPNDQRANVSKTFKRMLTQNYKRGINLNSKGMMQKGLNSTEQAPDSTASAASKYHPDFDQFSAINSEIENKFVRRSMKNKSLNKKNFQEDNLSVISTFLQEQFEAPKKGNVYKARKQSEMRMLQEIIDVRRPEDPYRHVDPMTHKVVISKEASYHSTSQQEIFIARVAKQEIEQKLNGNHFLVLPGFSKMDGSSDEMEKIYKLTKPEYQAYQQKVEYEVLEDSSELDEDSPITPDDDDRCGEEQPYQTAAYVRYKKDLEHKQINEIAKRSDIVQSSTLSFNLIPKDSRIISSIHTVNMSDDDRTQYIDERNSFNAMLKEYQYKKGQLRDKDKEYKDIYLKSFIHRRDFHKKSLVQFKNNVKELNKNRILEKPKDPEIQKQERIKHEQNKKAIEKVVASGYPVYNLVTVKKLLQGRAYDPPEDYDPNFIPEPIKPKQEEEDETHSRLEKQLLQWTDFTKMDLRKKHEHGCCGDEEDEIPYHIRKEFLLPHDMNLLHINYDNIKKHDASKKRLTPIWSGQDVLPIKLDYDKSIKVVEQINSHRVWPESQFKNFYKRIRSLLRIIAKSGQFDSLMTLCVLLNTITLAMERHGLQQEEKDLLELFDKIFTYIFIVEMGIKLLAIGIRKYLMDRMNWLDGFVVMLSVFEMIYKAAMKGTMDLRSLKTLRVFRTFRVFRVMRVLRALKSMQMIVGVIAKSYMSFIYITMLMFLFIYIFALLCMSIFGATMNFEDGTPRSNYDGMLISTMTTFQVLTMENWQLVLFSLMRGDNNKFLVSLILMGWIFLGNFILLNLFLAILLDAFLEEDDEMNQDEEELQKLATEKSLRAARRQQQRDKDKVIMRVVGQKKKERSALAKMLMGEENYESEELEDLDEEQIISIFKQQGIIKKGKEEQKEQKLYIGPPQIECQMSLYIFSKENRFRQLSYRLIKHPAWDNTIIVFIILSSVKLAFDTYLYTFSQDNPIINVSQRLDDFFNYAFIVELVVKVIAMGLFMDPGSYLRESWNQLDCFIVSSSIVDMTLQAMSDGQSIGFVKILRLLRVLRPLRMISRNPDLKLMVSALMESIGHIMNVVVVIAIIILIFAILGVNLFMGKFYYCSIDPLLLHTQIECESAGGQWQNRNHNFDNVIYAFNTLLIVASLEGWPDIMFYAADADDTDKGPKTDDNLTLASIFFLIYIMIGSFFLLNLFIGVLFVKFNQAKSENEKGLKTQDLAWMDIQRLILSQTPEYETTNVPQNEKRKMVHDLVCTRTFEIIIMTCIVLNMLQMALEFENAGPDYRYVLKLSNYIFSGVFIIEATLKLIAFGSSYFENGWNRFDFFVVTASVLDITMDIIGSGALSGVAFMPSLARVFRVLRVTRLFKLANNLKGLQAIIQTIIFSIGQLSNVVLLLFIILFMFTVLGVEMFKDITEGESISEFKNFRNFHQAMTLLLAIMTGEDWNRVMFDCSYSEEQGCVQGRTCGNFALALLYFNFLIIVCSYVMLQLFILVIIQQFDKYYLSQDNTIKTFKDDLDKFYKVWKMYTLKKYRCYRIKENMLQQFFRKLGGNVKDETSLGFHSDTSPDELKKSILKMGIKSSNGYVFFNELLYRCMRNKFGNMKLNRQMQIFELRTQYNIFLITQEVQQKIRKNKGDGQDKNIRDLIQNDMIKKSNGFNPFLTEMNYKITFKTWLKYARQRILVEEQGKDPRRQSVRQRLTDAFIKYIDVEIEAQREVEWTSEEDDYSSSHTASKKFGGSSSKDKLSRSAAKSRTIVGDVSETPSKKTDHLELFERQMLSKFKNLSNLKSSKHSEQKSSAKKAHTINNGESLKKQNSTEKSQKQSLIQQQLQQSLKKLHTVNIKKIQKYSQKQSQKHQHSHKYDNSHEHGAHNIDSSLKKQITIQNSLEIANDQLSYSLSQNEYDK